MTHSSSERQNFPVQEPPPQSDQIIVSQPTGVPQPHTAPERDGVWALPQAPHALFNRFNGEYIMDEIKNRPALNEDSEIDPSASRFYNSAERLVAHYNHCALCGSNLHFTHITDFNRNLTQEIARCPECGVKASQVQHRLQ
jgi:hypothetical protein